MQCSCPFFALLLPRFLAVASLVALAPTAAGCGTAANPAYCETHGTCESGRCLLSRNACADTECTADDHCKGEAPVCDPEQQVCRACRSDGECAAGAVCSAGRCVECVTSSDCSSGAPICDAGRCRGCAGDSDCALGVCTAEGRCAECEHASDCPGSAPVCSEAGQCRSCQGGDECASGVCTPEGSCADPASVLVVDASGGSDTATCGTASSPCRTVEHAQALLAPPLRWLRLSQGVHQIQQLVIDQAIDVGLALDQGTRLVAEASPALRIRPGAGLSVVGGIVDASGGAQTAIDCNGGAVILRAVDLRPGDRGIAASGCQIDIEEARVLGGSLGIEVTSSTLRVSRSELRAQSEAALMTMGGIAVIDNNLFVDGGPEADYTVYFSPSPAGSRFEHNTIAGNRLAADAYGSMHCRVDMPVRGNIVWNETGTSVTGNSTCAWDYSAIRDQTPAGNNFDLEPMFEADGSYRLAPGSPLIDVVPPSIDIDLQAVSRPQGQAADVGALEHLATP